MLSLQPGASQRQGQPLRARAGVEHDIGVIFAKRGEIGGRDEFRAKGRGDFLARGVDVDNRNVGAGKARAKRRDQQADDAGADHDDLVARPRARIPQRVERGLHIGGERRAPGRNVFRDGPQHIERSDEAALMRMEAENRPAQPLRWTGFDAADRAIAIFDGEREFALLKRRAHGFCLAGGNAPLEDEPLRAATDPAPQHGDARFARAGLANAGGAQRGLARSLDPKSARGVVLTICCNEHELTLKAGRRCDSTLPFDLAIRLGVYGATRAKDEADGATKI